MQRLSNSLWWYFSKLFFLKDQTRLPGIRSNQTNYLEQPRAYHIVSKFVGAVRAPKKTWKPSGLVEYIYIYIYMYVLSMYMYIYIYMYRYM